MKVGDDMESETTNKSTLPFKLVLTTEGKIYLCAGDTEIISGNEVVGLDYTEAIEAAIANKFVYEMIKNRTPIQESKIEIPGTDMYLLLRAEIRPLAELDINSSWQTDIIK